MTIAAAGLTAASATGAMAARTGQVTGRVVGGALPTPGRGATIVDAIEPATSRVTASTRARRDGTFKLGAVRPGVIMLIVDVVRSGRVQVTAVSPAVRVRAGRRTSIRVSLSVHRPVLPTRRARAGRAHGTARAVAAGPVIAVKRFAGSGPSSQLGHGLSSMLETDLVDQGPSRCGAQVVEWEHRDLLQQEIDLQRRHRELFDPATIVAKHWLSPTVFVVGNVGTAADGTVAWDLKLATSGGVVIGGDKGSVRGSEIFTATRAIAARLLTQLCPHLDPCALYSPAQAQRLLTDIVAGRRPVEDIQTLHGSHTPDEVARGYPIEECGYVSSWGDAVWVDVRLDTQQFEQQLRTFEPISGVGDAAYLETIPVAGNLQPEKRLYFFVGPHLLSVQILISPLEENPVGALIGLGQEVAVAARALTRATGPAVAS